MTRERSTCGWYSERESRPVVPSYTIVDYVERKYAIAFAFTYDASMQHEVQNKREDSM